MFDLAKYLKIALLSYMQPSAVSKTGHLPLGFLCKNSGVFKT